MSCSISDDRSAKKEATHAQHAPKVLIMIDNEEVLYSGIDVILRILLKISKDVGDCGSGGKSENLVGHQAIGTVFVKPNPFAEIFGFLAVIKFGEDGLAVFFVKCPQKMATYVGIHFFDNICCNIGGKFLKERCGLFGWE